MNPEQLAKFKAAQKERWALFAPLEILTTAPAGKLVAFAEVKAGEKVLDVGCGTGVVAITAARAGAKVTGLDLAPALLEKARSNADISQISIDFREGDVEELPFSNGQFDVVLSQFGHMFAPRPEFAIKEMLRVLKPGGRIAFSTWPPEMFTGRMFTLASQYVPMPPDIAPPPLWGDPQVIRQRLGSAVSHLLFERDIMVSPCLSVPLFRKFLESVGPLAKAQEDLVSEPEKHQKLRAEMEALITEYIDGNTVRQHFLMTRAIKI